ncbi:DNA/RNA-binding domain, partial [Penicillium canescens]
DTDQCPETGRIQHHLAVLSRPDTLQQFFYYTKALISVRPFSNARESMLSVCCQVEVLPFQLRQEVSRLGREGQQGVFITRNIAAIFQYGDKDGSNTKFTLRDGNTTADACASEAVRGYHGTQ